MHRYTIDNKHYLPDVTTLLFLFSSSVFARCYHSVIVALSVNRNNLTVFDMVLVKGFGAKELLRVGGKLPGPAASLRFNVPQSTLMECRDGEGHS